MTSSSTSTDVATVLGTHLPFLRRYARALTGGQDSGDSYAAATLEAILQDASVLDENLDPKVALFRVFHTIWTTSGAAMEPQSDGLEATAQRHLSTLTANTREALLLHTIEGFSFGDLASILDVSQGEAEELVKIAHREMEDSVSGRVLIIEDEAIIAMDLRDLVSDIGHSITGVARTRSQAVELGSETRPDLILADIQLADNSSGIDAVNDLLTGYGMDIPVIFITAFPERLLTGDRPEPAFLISKPYTAEQIHSAVSQAMFFASTETLRA